MKYGLPLKSKDNLYPMSLLLGTPEVMAKELDGALDPAATLAYEIAGGFTGETGRPVKYVHRMSMRYSKAFLSRSVMIMERPG